LQSPENRAGKTNCENSESTTSTFTYFKTLEFIPPKSDYWHTHTHTPTLPTPTLNTIKVLILSVFVGRFRVVTLTTINQSSIIWMKLRLEMI
jgi:hypothetical protein